MNTFASEAIIFSEDFTVNEDGNAVYSVKVTENSNIAGLSVTINYNKDKLKLLDAYTGEPLMSAMNSVNKAKAGIVHMSSITTTPITEGGSVINLVFDGKNAADISFSVSECIDKNLHNLNFSIKNTETNNPQVKAESESSVLENDHSKPETGKNESALKDDNAVNNSQRSTDNIQSQTHDSTVANDGTVANKDGTNTSETKTSDEKIAKPETNNKSENTKTLTQGSTNDIATEDESTPSSHSIIWVILIIAICVVIITILIILKRRKKE